MFRLPRFERSEQVNTWKKCRTRRRHGCHEAVGRTGYKVRLEIHFVNHDFNWSKSLQNSAH